MTKRETGRISIELTIANTDMECLLRFQKIVGCGHIKGSKGNALSKKELYRWGVYSRDGFWSVMAMLLPHMSKRRQERGKEVMQALAEYVDGRSVHWSVRKREEERAAVLD